MEEHKSVKVHVSPKQLSRLRNGHKVRVKKPMEGQGVAVIVDPMNYSLLTKTFSRNKGMELALSPQEIAMNKGAAAQMEGQGIFGKRFDRAFGRIVGKRARKQIYDVARDYLPLAQAALTGGIATAGTALGVAQPELIPFIAPAIAGLSTIGSDYLANPSAYQSNAGGSKAKLASNLAGRYVQDQALGSLNAQLGTNMGNLSRASIANALSDKAMAELNARSVAEKQRESVSAYERALAGQGLYAGQSSGRGVSKSAAIVGLNGGLVRHSPQALRSQPLGANFQFSKTLPPAYQRFSGSGLML
jgi:hypothetical protein